MFSLHFYHFDFYATTSLKIRDPISAETFENKKAIGNRSSTGETCRFTVEPKVFLGD